MDSNWPIVDSEVNALLIVAHPDDETIFCGGTILSHPSWSWNIVCVTMQQNTSRPQEFESTINMYRGFGVNINSSQTLNKPDYNQDLSQQDYDEWKESINQLNLKPEIVLTHNIMGEYGHKHHIATSKIVQELFKNVWEFVYPGDPSISPQPRKSIVKELTLDQILLSRKKEIYDTCYKSQAYVWQVLPELMKYEFETGPEIFTSGDENED